MSQNIGLEALRLQKLHQNTTSVGHGGNSQSSESATVSQTLNDLFARSNTSRVIPIVSLLTQIFEACQSGPFRLDSLGLLKILSPQAEGLGVGASLLKTSYGLLAHIFKSGGGRGR
jgi:hypothetical protein